MTIHQLPTPCYLVDEKLIERNLKILRSVIDRTGCRILLAQKAFSMFALYPLIGRYLCGTAASGLFEAKLGREEMPDGEVHTFSAAFRPDEIEAVAEVSDHIIFNSHAQLECYRETALAAGCAIGLRINPMCSTQEHAIYDPCTPGSRMGIPPEAFDRSRLEGVTGLHFHTLCEQNADALEATLEAVERHFGDLLPRMQWLNMGGGHHITRADYDVERLVRLIERMRDRYGLTIYLEPGEAVALNAGFLITEVLDIVHNGMDIAILDTSAACHMPDVIEMPYRPPLLGSGEAGEKAHTYRLGGPTCLAGDIIGDYSFDHPLHPGDRLIFGDMAIYSMVKNNTFNGMNLPAIALGSLEGEDCRVIRRFGYADFKGRLS